MKGGMQVKHGEGAAQVQSEPWDTDRWWLLRTWWGSRQRGREAVLQGRTVWPSQHALRASTKAEHVRS